MSLYPEDVKCAFLCPSSSISPVPVTICALRRQLSIFPYRTPNVESLSHAIAAPTVLTHLDSG